MRKQKRRFGCLLPLAVLVLAAGYLLAEWFFSNNVLVVESISLSSDNVPEGFDGYTIVQLSDLHEKYFGKDGDDLIRQIKEIAPDMIAVTGDFIHSVEGLPYLRKMSAALAAVAPVYYVTGNHEWAVEWAQSRIGQGSFLGQMKDIFAETGVSYCDSQIIPLERNGHRLDLVGICDPNGPDYAPNPVEMYGQWTGNPDKAPFSVALYHRNDFFEEYGDAAFDLVLAGHAHGGVLRLPFTDGFIGPDRDFFPAYTSGLYEKGQTSLVVHRGLGDTYAPRMWNRPQILVITLEAKAKS